MDEEFRKTMVGMLKYSWIPENMACYDLLEDKNVFYWDLNRDQKNTTPSK